MRFFIDNNLSWRIASALAPLADYEKDEVVHIRDKYGADAKDPDWIPRLAAEGDWVIVSGDCKIRTKPIERRLLQEAKLTTFFLSPGWVNCHFWQQAALMVKWWPAVRRQAKLAYPGSVYEVPFRGAGRFKPITL